MMNEKHRSSDGAYPPYREERFNRKDEGKTIQSRDLTKVTRDKSEVSYAHCSCKMSPYS